jgi:thymidylate synthase
MDTIKARNVNDAFPRGILFLNCRGERRASRNGPVIEYENPVSISYTRPQERVLFDKVRDINPFLHFFEPLWILAGQQDVEFLADIVSTFKEYSDNGDVFYGAYGHRMRHPNDQIEKAIEILKQNPDDRRVVLQIRKPDDMWYSGKDQPCNTAIACKIRNGALNIHVFNRSNDFIWGMTGANMPQFSILQEYMAGCIGCEVGVYHQTTDSMHVYTELNDKWEKVKNHHVHITDPYREGAVTFYPLFKETTRDKFNSDLINFFENYERVSFDTPFFVEVVKPMWEVFIAHKHYRNGLDFVNNIRADDWRLYTTEWLERRYNKDKK